MPPITFTVQAPTGEAQNLQIPEALSTAFAEAVDAQPGMTVQQAVEFALEQYVASAQHFQQQQTPPA